MGWKNVKEHYGIKHIVANYEKGLCIGSQYCHDLIIIRNTDSKMPGFEDDDWSIRRRPLNIGCNLSIWRMEHLGRGEPFDGWVKTWSEDPQTLRRLIDEPDTFRRTIVVYTYDHAGNIIEKECEEYGWPNVTHDGLIMYENMFSTDKAKVVRWAKRSMRAWVKNATESVAQRERDLERVRANHIDAVAAFAKLNADFPDIDPDAPEPDDDEADSDC